MRIITLIAILTLSSCAAPLQNRITQMQVTVIEDSNAEHYCSLMYGSYSSACALPFTPRGCEIHITPDDARESDVIGHEFRHCFQTNVD